MTYVDNNKASGTEVPKALPYILKRSGDITDFDVSKIEAAMQKAFNGAERVPNVPVAELARRVVQMATASNPDARTVSVETIQDIVEMVLQAAGEFKTAKAYILYRQDHANKREERPIPEAVRQAFDDSAVYFPTQLQQFQFFDKYSRFDYDLGRRETWVETVTRTTDFLYELAGDRLESNVYERIKRGILEMKVTPSMRLLAMAGPAARRQNLGLYNCSYMEVDCIDTFVEALIISMAGCGVGFSVETENVEKFPRIKRQSGRKPENCLVEDSAEGWANALRTGLETWFSGGDILFDLSLLRPAGAVLRIKGGRASGPEPFRYMLEKVRQVILNRQGSFLRSIDAHDIMCLVGNAAVSGGVRRTAMISLFSWDDEEMHNAKNPGFDVHNSQRWNANNSVVWPEGGITQLELVKQMTNMVSGGSGEPGIFNRQAAWDMNPERRKKVDANGKLIRWGTNPCGEILLQNAQLCNLSAVVARAEDTYFSLYDKVELATIIGSIQSMATYFPGLRPQWAENCQEERLLGVDITGQLDSQAAMDPLIKKALRKVAVDTNQIYAKNLGINQSAAVTCVKPSGNTSQLVDCASGLHARWAPYYIRNVRVAATAPVFKVMQDAGVPLNPENGQTVDNANTWVASFPVKAPDGAITRNGRTAIQQCQYWLNNKLNYTEHNPSCFSGSTRFVTSEGLRTFDSFEKNQDVIILDSEGKWKTGIVKQYGKQPIWELEVERNRNRMVIKTTENHQWPITTPQGRFRNTPYKLFTTSELAKYQGDTNSKLMTINPVEQPSLDMEGVLHGIVFGDGTSHHGKTSVNLCKGPLTDKRSFAEFFTEAGYKSVNREDLSQIRIYGLPGHWKALPDINSSPSYIRGFIAGWFATDGHMDTHGNSSISNKIRENLEWLQEQAPVAGLAVSTHISFLSNTSNFGNPDYEEHYSEWYSIAFVKETISANFLISQTHIDRYDSVSTTKYWKILSVKPTEEVENVFCIETTGDHLFVLEGNILTHNCTITYKPEEVLDLMAWVWQHKDQIGGMAFLPSYDADYAQLPYIEITQEEYEKRKAAFPVIEWAKIFRYETEDFTEAAQTLACAAAGQDC